MGLESVVQMISKFDNKLNNWDVSSGCENVKPTIGKKIHCLNQEIQSLALVHNLNGSKEDGWDEVALQGLELEGRFVTHLKGTANLLESDQEVPLGEWVERVEKVIAIADGYVAAAGEGELSAQCHDLAIKLNLELMRRFSTLEERASVVSSEIRSGIVAEVENEVEVLPLAVGDKVLVQNSDNIELSDRQYGYLLGTVLGFPEIREGGRAVKFVSVRLGDSDQKILAREGNVHRAESQRALSWDFAPQEDLENFRRHFDDVKVVLTQCGFSEDDLTWIEGAVFNPETSVEQKVEAWQYYSALAGDITVSGNITFTSTVYAGDEVTFDQGSLVSNLINPLKEQGEDLVRKLADGLSILQHLPQS